ncbi:unnamed protein product, partial [Ectocarpus sp. 12 AP-2014]
KEGLGGHPEHGTTGRAVASTAPGRDAGSRAVGIWPKGTPDLVEKKRNPLRRVAYLRCPHGREKPRGVDGGRGRRRRRRPQTVRGRRRRGRVSPRGRAGEPGPP